MQILKLIFYYLFTRDEIKLRLIESHVNLFLVCVVFVWAMNFCAFKLTRGLNVMLLYYTILCKKHFRVICIWCQFLSWLQYCSFCFATPWVILKHVTDIYSIHVCGCQVWQAMVKNLTNLNKILCYSIEIVRSGVYVVFFISAKLQKGFNSS